jgi:hypothetical protein
LAKDPSKVLVVSWKRIQQQLLKKSKLTFSSGRLDVTENHLTIVLFGTTVGSDIFAVAKGATAIAASVIHIPAQPCALITARKYVKGFQSHPMFAMVVKIKDHVH